MRENKFRAWDKLNSKWVYFTIGQTWSDIALIVYHQIILDGGVFYRFTGLKDKNGVEIYEGSIIAVMRGNDLVLNAKEVFYHKGCPCLDIEYDGEISPLYWYEEDEKFEFQVIGNIHQNKDLLK